MSDERKGFVVWLTGLSGAGKSTIASLLQAELAERGRLAEVLDGDEVRTNLSRGLGFSKEDRDTNIRRIGYVARLLARNGAVAITAAISPYREIRDEVRAQTPNFVEVFVRCSLDELVRRDVKGLYRKAIAGEIPNFTGVSDPYEEPLRPEVVVDSERQSPAESVAAVLRHLERSGLVPTPFRDRLLRGEELAAARAEARALPRLAVDARAAADLFMLGSGALSPLEGFLGEEDYRSVLETARLAGGAPLGVPVVLRVDAAGAGAHGRVALFHEGAPVGILQVEEVYDAPAGAEAACVYGTNDPAHPGVAALERAGARVLAGPVTAFLPDGLGPYDLTPHEVRQARAERGWRTMVGFQTRNPVHRAHEYLQKVALENVDGLLLHPLIGETKSDDIPAETRMRCYEELLRGYYPAERTLLATNPAWMRYAGPREAIFHSVVRRNYGCTHFIVGRDHAGVGSYYDTYAAHRVFDAFTAGELGIEVLRFEHTFWCRRCQNMASTRTCPHRTEDHATLSGTRVRQLLSAGEALPPEFTRPEVAGVLRAAQESARPA
ncbi:MAG TPA: sulfate adenylyltransferase [Terriglobales bacterium]|nr:sulfate adenylyltransferase [Terriglobales bacterium]